MPIGRQSHSEPLFTLMMFGLLVAVCVFAAAVMAQQPHRRDDHCGRCGQPLPATCPECGQRLTPEKQAAVPQQQKAKTKPQPRPTQDDDTFDIVAPAIFGF